MTGPDTSPEAVEALAEEREILLGKMTECYTPALTRRHCNRDGIWAAEFIRKQDTLLRALSSKLQEAERERDEAKTDLAKEWCASCGTISADGTCHCTDDALSDKRRASPYVRTYGKDLYDAYDVAVTRAEAAERERDALQARVKVMEEALRYIGHDASMSLYQSRDAMISDIRRRARAAMEDGQ
jgi:hypothetical protein